MVQLKGSPGVEGHIGCPGSAFEAEVDEKEENQIVNVKWSQRPAKDVDRGVDRIPGANVLQAQSLLLKSLREFFYSTQLVEVQCPVITSNDCEGGGDAFHVGHEGFFKSEAFLTVSSQLHLELACADTAGVFTIGPVFRAEKHDSRRHLAEFRMAEVELPYATELEPLIDHCARAIRHCVLAFKTDPRTTASSSAIASLEKAPVVLSYAEAIGILKSKNQEAKWGMSIQFSDELFIVESLGNCPVFITDYPMALKPFYMKQDHHSGGNKIAKCFDLIIPELGEVAGGSLRETLPETLFTNMGDKNADAAKLDWYLALRSSGHPPTGGYGIGIERLLCSLVGAKNVRDVVLCPRVRGPLHH